MFDWKNYLTLAEEILDSNTSEEACRASISRAYYSVFNLCKDRYLSLSGDVMQKKDSHWFIIEKYIKEKKPASSIGHKLNSLKVKRIKSDYESKDKIDIGKAKETIALARKIIEKDLILINQDFFQR